LRKDVYFERLEGALYGRMEGALYGRMAGCTLGAPVEFWPIAERLTFAGEERPSAQSSGPVPLAGAGMRGGR